MPLRRYRATLAALADTVLPAAPGCPAGSELVPAALDDLTTSMHAAEVKQLATVLGLFEVGALPSYGRRFSRLSAEKRERYLRGWMRSRLAFRRQIYRALRDLVCNLYYNDPRAWDQLGYEGPPVAKERAS